MPTLSKTSKQQIAVIGLGRFGSSAAIQLASLGYDVLGVDKNADLVENMSDELTHVVRADTSNEGALEELGIRNFGVVVVGISSDVQSSIVTTLILKHLDVPYVIAKARDELHGEILDRIGADKVRSVLDSGAAALVTGNPGCMMQIGAGLRLRGSGIPVLHLVEVLDESYRRDGRYRSEIP